MGGSQNTSDCNSTVQPIAASSPSRGNNSADPAFDSRNNSSRTPVFPPDNESSPRSTMMSCTDLASQLHEPKTYKSDEKQRVTYETTTDGDVRTIVVEPSFDGAESRRGWQSRTDEDEQLHSAHSQESRASPMRAKRGHNRNLSAHFLEATRLERDSSPTIDKNETRDTVNDLVSFTRSTPPSRTEERSFPLQQARPSNDSYPHPGASWDEHEKQKQNYNQDEQRPYPYQDPEPRNLSSGADRKHRRWDSGGRTNPPMAHRRVNSIGKVAHVNRGGPHEYHQGHYADPRYNYAPPPPQQRGGHQGNYPYPEERRHRGHHREASAGLDMLSAVANVSKEELAANAGHRGEPHSEPHGDPRPSQSSSRQYPPHYRNQPPPMSHMSPEGSGDVEYARGSEKWYQGSYQRGPPGDHSRYPPSMRPGAPYSHGYVPYHHGFYSQPVSPPYGHGHYPPPPYHHPSHCSSDPYMPHPPEGGPPMDHSRRPPGSERINNQEPLFVGSSGQNRTTAVQTYVTSIGAGEGGQTKSVGANVDQGGSNDRKVPSLVGHHRKLSSWSSLGGSMLMNDVESFAAAAHKRGDSSISFHGFLDSAPLEGNENFTHNRASPLAYDPLRQNGSSGQYDNDSGSSSSARQSNQQSNTQNEDASKKGVPGFMRTGTSKRVRRKCTRDGCTNRVVQGGLCISHGAKRKTCMHPGCNKNVKKAGLCSKHGPERRKCDFENCGKVAVQGGRCISHGAKKKLCSVEKCEKQAILSGMCKKHHDAANGIVKKKGSKSKPKPSSAPLRRSPVLEGNVCVAIKEEEGTMSPSGSKDSPHHERGLSILQDLGADHVSSLLQDGDLGGGAKNEHPLRHLRLSREAV